MVPKAMMIVDAETPINNWKLPVAEDFPISIALSKFSPSLTPPLSSAC
jgi:hypothetical protein